MTRDTHVLPVNDLVDHDDNRTCWCGPLIEAPCPEDCGDGCWKCEDGFVTVAPEHPDECLVIHNAADGRP